MSVVHESEETNLKSDITPEHNLSVTIESDRFTEEKFALFSNYQRHVHKEDDGDISRTGFKRFLCASPIKRRTDSDGKRLGSFHQCYRLDGRLIAMAVLDLLPHAVSAVYFIYHSDFEKWSFGKLSALQEAALAHEGGYQYYYMGFYIPSCKKMRYKGDYKQQYVLDYDSHTWDPLDDKLRTLMDTRKYASMTRERKRKTIQESLDAAESEHGSDDPSVQKAKTVLDSFDESQKPLYPSPVDAMQTGLSLLQIGMPGIMSLKEIREHVNLGNMRVRVGGGRVMQVQVSEVLPDTQQSCPSLTLLQQSMSPWASGSELDGRSFKGLFAEFAAVVGPVIAREGVLEFS